MTAGAGSRARKACSAPNPQGPIQQDQIGGEAARLRQQFASGGHFAGHPYARLGGQEIVE
jgi:hypothetical protein